MTSRSSSHIKVLKTFPIPFAGIGANFRRLSYSGDRKFSGLKLSGAHTLNDLRKWNWLTVEVLSWTP